MSNPLTPRAESTVDERGISYNKSPDPLSTYTAWLPGGQGGYLF